MHSPPSPSLPSPKRFHLSVLSASKRDRRKPDLKLIETNSSGRLPERLAVAVIVLEVEVGGEIEVEGDIGRMLDDGLLIRSFSTLYTSLDRRNDHWVGLNV